MPQAQVLPIPPGSLLVLTDVVDPDDPVETIDALYRAVGHRDFGILTLESGALAEVYGPDEIVERVRALLSEGAVAR